MRHILITILSHTSLPPPPHNLKHHLDRFLQKKNLKSYEMNNSFTNDFWINFFFFFHITSAFSLSVRLSLPSLWKFYSSLSCDYTLRKVYWIEKYLSNHVNFTEKVHFIFIHFFFRTLILRTEEISLFVCGTSLNVAHFSNYCL